MLTQLQDANALRLVPHGPVQICSITVIGVLPALQHEPRGIVLHHALHMLIQPAALHAHLVRHTLRSPTPFTSCWHPCPLALTTAYTIPSPVLFEPCTPGCGLRVGLPTAVKPSPSCMLTVDRRP